MVRARPRFCAKRRFQSWRSSAGSRNWRRSQQARRHSKTRRHEGQSAHVCEVARKRKSRGKMGPVCYQRRQGFDLGKRHHGRQLTRLNDLRAFRRSSESRPSRHVLRAPAIDSKKWQGFPSATPANRFFGFSHVLDGGWSGNHYCRSWQMLGLNEFGPIVNVDKTPAPFWEFPTSGFRCRRRRKTIRKHTVWSRRVVHQPKTKTAHSHTNPFGNICSRTPSTKQELPFQSILIARC